jgi:predicted nucleic acid-binding protein
MILVDTSVWIDHLRASDEMLQTLLQRNRVRTHPFVIGEISLGSLRQRDAVLGALNGLPKATVATESEVSRLIDDETLHGLGIAYGDVHLLAAARLTPGTALWTRDRRLHAVAERLGLAAKPAR